MSSESDRAAIYRHRDAYTDTLRGGDLDGWLATLSNDCVLLPPGAPALVGKEEIRPWVKSAFFDVFQNDLEYDFEEIEFVGSWAFAWGWFRQVLTPKEGGEALELRGKFLDVFRREDSGAWVLARVAFNTDHE